MDNFLLDGECQYCIYNNAGIPCKDKKGDKCPVRISRYSAKSIAHDMGTVIEELKGISVDALNAPFSGAEVKELERLTGEYMVDLASRCTLNYLIKLAECQKMILEDLISKNGGRGDVV